MGLLQPAPNVIGPLSLTAMVGLIICVHFIICVIVIASVSSAEVMTISAVEISPTIQCIAGAIFLLGIPICVHAGIGTLYKVPSHLSAYIIYLFLTFVCIGIFFGTIATYEQSCITSSTKHASELAVLTCGIPTATTFAQMCVALMLICVAIYMVWSLNEQLKRRLETDLFRYQEPLALQAQLADEAAAQAAEEAKAAAKAAHRMAVPGALWSQQPGRPAPA